MTGRGSSQDGPETHPRHGAEKGDHSSCPCEAWMPLGTACVSMVRLVRLIMVNPSINFHLSMVRLIMKFRVDFWRSELQKRPEIIHTRLPSVWPPGLSLWGGENLALFFGWKRGKQGRSATGKSLGKTTLILTVARSLLGVGWILMIEYDMHLICNIWIYRDRSKSKRFDFRRREDQLQHSSYLLVSTIAGTSGNWSIAEAPFLGRIV